MCFSCLDFQLVSALPGIDEHVSSCLPLISTELKALCLRVAGG